MDYNRLIDYLKKENYEEAIDFLNQQVGTTRRTPSGTVKNKAITIILNEYSSKPHKLFDIAHYFANQTHPTGKEISTYLLVEVYELAPTHVMELLRLLADDDDWEVREWVASACGEHLKNHFESFYPEMAIWAKDQTGNVRRAAALSVKYACQAKNTDWTEPLLDLVELLLTDNDPYVKKNLGPFTIGDALLRAYPDATLSRLNKWISIVDVNARWNIAKVFTTAEGAKNAEQAIPIIKILLNDERPVVKRAVKSLTNTLKKRQPKIFDLLEGE